ncbi:amino acid adenylation domain-containing protein [Paenibacillus sp.]
MLRENVENIVAISPTQEGILYHSMDEHHPSYYFEQLNIGLTGKLDITNFKRAWRAVVETNESLRSQFRWTGLRQPVQIILKTSIPNIRIESLQNNGITTVNEQVEQWIREDRELGFRLQEEVPFRIHLFQLNTTQYRMIISSHHILYDGWSTGIILKEFWHAYHNLRQGKEADLLPKRKTSDYIKWIHNLDLVNEATYWQRKLVDLEHAPVRTLALAHGSAQDHAHQETYIMTKEQTEHLKQVALDNQMTIAGLCYAAWALVLHLYSGRQDILFGTTLSGRDVPLDGITEMVGLFIKTLPVRVTLDGSTPGIMLLEQIKMTLQECEQNSHYPLVQILQDADQSAQGFDTLFVVQNYPLIQMDSNSTPDEPLAITSHTMTEHAHYPISAGVQTFGDLRITLSYLTHHFDSVFIQGMIEDFVYFLNHMQELTRGTVDQLLDMHQTEWRRRQSLTNSGISQALNISEEDSSQELEPIYSIQYELRTSQTPDQVAVVFREEEWTYNRINNRANHLALKLRALGVQAEVPVAIYMSRSVDLLVATLAVMKAGGAFVPVDPALPASRILNILNDTQSPFVIVDHLTRDVLAQFGSTHKVINASELEEDQQVYPDIKMNRSGHDLAYILYTSGTSGKPKGVMIEHHNLVHFIRAFDRKLGWSPDKTILGLSTFSFDIFIVEVLLPLLTGMKVVMADSVEQKDPIRLCELIERHDIHIMQLTPTRMKTLLSHPANVSRLQCLTDVLLGGEGLPEQLVRSIQVNLNAEVYNLYGPTETTVWSTVYRFSDQQGIFIGAPIDGVNIYVADRSGRMKPRGVAGELCIGGKGVGRGYWNNPELTEKCFVPDLAVPGQWMYRTGDLGRFDGEGQLEFLGRMDRQVKIRGYRIELAEVESHLLAAPLVAAAAVIVREEGSTEPYLCAYLVGTDNLNSAALRTYMLSKLPDYMVPSYFVEVDRLPQNNNGKLDINALPLPELKNAHVEGSEDTQDGNRFTPRSEMDHVLMHVWQETFSVAGSVSANTHFMELGGHSLQAMYLVMGIQKELGINITVQEIYRYPTLGQLAVFLRTTDKNVQLPEIVRTAEAADYPLSSAQLGMYLTSTWDSGDMSYNLPFMIEIEGQLDPAKVERAFQKLIQRHESLRTSFHTRDREIRQVVHPKVSFELTYEVIEREKLRAYQDEFIIPFHLQHAPLFRIRLLKLGDSDYVILGDLHHIIADNHTLRLLLLDFSRLYEQYADPELQLQYKDFAVWEKTLEQSAAYGEAEQYWKSIVEGAPPPAALPSDGAAVQSRRGGNHLEWQFTEELSSKLEELAEQNGTSIFAILLTAHYIMMHKYTGQEDITVGVPLSGRWHPDLEKLSGMFVNTMPIRNVPTAPVSFVKLLREVRTSILQALQYQFYPLTSLTRNDRGSSQGSTPFYHTVFTMLPLEEEWNISGLTLKMYPLHHTQSKFDLTITVLERDQLPIKLMIEYADTLFMPASAAKWAERYMHVLEQVTVRPNISIAEITVITEHDTQLQPQEEEVNFQF